MIDEQIETSLGAVMWCVCIY